MADSNGKVDIGRVITNTFGVISRNPVVFLGLSFLILGVPNAILQFVQGSPDVAATAIGSPTVIITSIVGLFVVMFFSVILQATLVVATVKDLSGEKIDIGSCVSKAISKFLPLLGLGILVALGVGFGMLLLIVPGIILALMWMVSSPVMMTENLGVIDSMKRSAELTSGSKGMLFLLMIIYLIAAAVIGSVIGGLGYAVGMASATGLAIFALITNTITGAIQGAVVASIYVDLRTEKEGTNTHALADVFS